MNNFYWIIEFSATFIELMLSLIFCGTFIENSDLNYNFKKRFIISVIGVFLMIFINYIELYSPMTVVFAFILTSFL
ncbi:MAG: hypothetical protein K2J39_04945, partial [Ruminococcus sp.]|nr:hypothetical protein [Ruminococcus sp.]